MSGRHRRTRPRWTPALFAVVIAMLVAAAAYSAVTISSTADVAAPGDPGVFDRTATVSKVVDGDSFVIDGGVTVRVLAADSCEARTDAGPRGRADAETVLRGATVTLRREPTARNDADRDGRLLRYVEVPGLGDLGSYMVGKDHTAVYTGQNDASADYLARLRSEDPNGRRCIENLPAPDVAPEVVYPDCVAARAAGLRAIYAGDPGYTRALDGNDDGVACE